MKFRVERDVLADAVTWTARTLPNRPPVPVLAGLHLEAAEGVLRLSSFDYEVSARVEIPAEIDDPGTVLVSGRLLAEICRSLPAKPVDIDLDGTKVTVVCGASRFTLLTMPVDEYPALPAMPDLTGTIDADQFASAVSQVTAAASKDETLPLLTGVRIEIDGEKLTLLATDRYRLAMREMSWHPSNPSFATEALVKAKTLTEVSKSLGSSGQVNVSLSTTGGKELIGFEAGGRRTTSLLVDGDYPPVRRLFPSETPIYAVAERSKLIDAARRVSLVAERNTPVRLTFSDGQLILEAGQGDDAQASEAIESTLVGEDVTTAFNPGFLLDGLSALTTQYVRVSFTHPSKPAVLTGQAELDGDNDVSYRYLLMPIRFAG